MAERKLTVVITGDAKGFTSAVATADRSASGLGSKLGGLSTKAKAAFAGAGFAAIGFAKGSVDAFVEAEEAQKALADAFERFPNLAGTSQEALQKLNSELQRKTKYDDDAIASGQAVVAQFGITGKQLESLTPLIVDYASRTGKDIPAAAQDVGKAMLGNAKALKNIGIKYTATGDKAKDFANIQELLRQQVGGFAEKEGTTAAGKAAILANQFGELQETVGSKLVPALLVMADFITTKVLPVLGGIGSWLREHKPVLIAVAGVIGVGLVAAFVSWAAAAGAAAAATIAATWPILAIIGVVAALVAGVIYAYQHWDVFRSVVDAVARFVRDKLWPALQAIAGWITGTLVPVIVTVATKIGEWVGIVAGVVADITGKITGFISFLGGIPSQVAAVATQIWNALKTGLSAAVRWIREKLDSLLGPLDEIAGKVGGVIGKAGGIAGNVLGGLGGLLAEGGPARAGVPYIVGERGPELFIPGTSGTVIPNGGGSAASMTGGNSYQITVMVPVGADKGIAGQEIVEAISAYERRNGPGWRN